LNITLTLTQDGCSSERIDTAFIVVKPQPVASFSVSKNPICSGVPVTLTFNGITNSYNGSSVAYNWNFAGGTASPGSGQGPQTVTFTNSDTLFHSYYPSLSLQQDGCTSALFLDTFSLFPIKKFEILATPNFCIGQTGYLYSSQAFANYQWSTGSSNDSILVQISGHYVLTVTDNNGCIDSNFYDLTIKPAPHANAGSNQELYAGNYVQLDGSTSYGGNAFNWSPFINMSANNVASPYVAPMTTTQYILAYTDTTNGCVDRDTVTVFVKECADLIIPNAFSPNQDGADDYFMIMNPDAIYKLEQFTVYNRWGQKVFDTDDKSSQGWDGKFNGRDQEIGVYVYLIIAECGGGKQFKRKGNLTLIR
jgi:gliding motility-associated-like protein